MGAKRKLSERSSRFDAFEVLDGKFSWRGYLGRGGALLFLEGAGFVRKPSGKERKKKKKRIFEKKVQRNLQCSQE